MEGNAAEYLKTLITSNLASKLCQKLNNMRLINKRDKGMLEENCICIA